MAKAPKTDLSNTMRIMGKMAAMPHMPHLAKKKSLTESLKKKGDAPIAKKKRRPQEA